MTHRAARLLAQATISLVVVCNEDDLRRVSRDALQELLKEVEYEELLLRDYVMGIGYR